MTPNAAFEFSKFVLVEKKKKKQEHQPSDHQTSSQIQIYELTVFQLLFQLSVTRAAKSKIQLTKNETFLNVEPTKKSRWPQFESPIVKKEMEF